MKRRILIIDDEKNILISLGRALEVEDFSVAKASSGEEGLEIIEKNPIDLVLLDVAMPGIDGLDVLERAKKNRPELPIVMMSGHSTIETAVRATKLGAYDFVEKPISTERIILTIDNALKLNRLVQENEELRANQHSSWEMLGQTPQMKRLKDIISRTANSLGRALITGENGTGKELVARAIHMHSERANGPFIKVNCAAIPQELIESELFGHEKGAFTGATTQRKGKFEAADGGTLFLDEIGDMSIGAQAKVLRVLQEGEVERVGGNKTLNVDVRVVSATNKKMHEEIEAGRFREDLYYRLAVVPIEVPPLRERKQDIPILSKRFMVDAAAIHGRKEQKLSESVISMLMQHDWPGNIRELKNTIERLVILSDGEIHEDDLESILPHAKKSKTIYRRGVGLKEMTAAVEREIIIAALNEYEGQVAKAAEDLGIERSHLYKKMKALGIERG